MFHVQTDMSLSCDCLAKNGSKPFFSAIYRIVKGPSIHLGIHGRGFNRHIDLGHTHPIQFSLLRIKRIPCFLGLIQCLKKRQIPLEIPFCLFFRNHGLSKQICGKGHSLRPKAFPYRQRFLR